jgi:hypothetical protein
MPRKPAVVLALASTLLAAAAIGAQTPPAEIKPAAPPAMQRSGGSPQGGPNPVEELMKSIAGKEKEPSEVVFKNIQILKGVPAGQLVDIMRLGFSRSLGVRCSFCHVMGRWEKDDKSDKQVTREMLRMTNTINTQLLPNIKGLMSDKPQVTCATCHRGQEKPATSMEAAGGEHGEKPAPPAHPGR